MSTNLRAAVIMEADDPRDLEEQARREAIQTLDSRVLVEVAMTQYVAELANRLHDYGEVFVRTGDTTGFMPSTTADGIGQELHAAMDRAASQLLTQAAMGRGLP